MIIVVLVVIALLAVNALFVAAEFAIVGAPRPSIEELAEKGSAAAITVRDILRDPRKQDRYIATAQLGITVASLGLGMYAEAELAEWLVELTHRFGAPAWLASHAAASILAIVALTYLHIVLGEMVPKAIALASPAKAAIWLTPVMRIAEAATLPFVYLLNGLGNGLLRVFGVERRFGGGAQNYTAEELQFVVRESEELGLLDAEAAHVLDELIEFGDLSAWEVMVPRVKVLGIEVGASLEELAETISAQPHARYPVYAHDLDHIVGMIHIKDIARALSTRRGVRQSDVRAIPYVPGSSTLDSVLTAMRKSGVQMAVVMDEHGGTDGIITTEDLIEEVIGDIDEADVTEAPELVVEESGALVVAGTVRIEEIGEELDRRLEHDDVDTVSGLVLDLLDRPPLVGDRVEWEGLELQVTAVKGHGVAQCRVTTRTTPIERLRERDNGREQINGNGRDGDDSPQS